MVVERFGKSLFDIMEAKKSFFSENSEKLARARRDAVTYTAQPQRSLCKICSVRLPDKKSFQKLGVGYTYCTDCGHLNGIHEDTDEFCEYLYVRDSGYEYAENYSSPTEESRSNRVENIYRPKASFALENIPAIPTEISVVDFGCGAGFLLEAFGKMGVRSLRGYEPSATLRRQAEQFLGPGVVRETSLEGITEIVSGEGATLACMVGFIEHVQDPVGLLKALTETANFDYLLVTFPCASPSVAVEAVFPEVMPRHLTGGHTHLFTQESITRLESLAGLSRLAEWWFGTDMLDLFRSVVVTLESARAPSLASEWTRAILPAIDEMQLAIDKKKASSQVHVVYRLR